MFERQTSSVHSTEQHQAAQEEGPEASHPPLSPASGAEALFLAGLTSIPSGTLSSQLRTNNSGNGSSSVSLNTTATDDFVSAAGTMDDLYQFAFDDEDQAARSQQLTIPELDSDTTDEDSISMPKTKKAPAAVAKQDPTPMPPKEPVVVVVATAAAAEPAAAPEGSHPDAASAAYEGAKGVWAWGKSVPVFSPFMGFTEAVAGKALEVAGTNLRDLDGNLIKPNLEKLDSGVLNPVVETVAGMMLGAAGKVEEVVKPIVVLVLSPFKMLTQPPPPADDTPEVTTEAGN